MARGALGDGESVTLSVMISSALDGRLREFMADSGYRRSEAARVLMERGLDAEGGAPRVSVRRGRSVSASTQKCSHPIARRIGKGCGLCGTENVG